MGNMGVKDAKSIQKKDLFLCHNSADKDSVRDLGAKIEREKVGERNLSVFFDEWDIEIGENFILKIDEALQHARYVAIMLSPEMLRSDWCKMEWTSALAQDPTNRLARIIPVRLRDVSIDGTERIVVPTVLAPLNYLDFRDKKNAKRSFDRLIAKLKGEEPTRGGGGGGGRGGAGRGTRSATTRRSDDAATLLVAALPEGRDEPDRVPETLISNLLPVRTLPRFVRSAPTKLRTKSELPSDVRLPPFLLKEGRLLTFHDPRKAESIFREHCSAAETEEHALRDWRHTPDRWNWVIELLQESMRQHLQRDRVIQDRRTKRYFFRKRETGSVYLTWTSGTRRCVVRAPDIQNGNWVHQGARLWFETVGTQLYLSVEPSYVFTSDGVNPIRGPEVGPLAMMWGGKERNGTVLRHTLMWSDVLARGRKNAVITADDQTIVIGRLPDTVLCPVSLADDKVGIQALMQFTEHELDLTLPDEKLFAYDEVVQASTTVDVGSETVEADCGGL